MASINEFKHETLQDTKSIIEYLKILTEGFENGELVFRNDREQILLNPEGMIQMEVKARKKEKKGKLSIKFYWKEQPVSDSDEDVFIINSKI